MCSFFHLCHPLNHLNRYITLKSLWRHWRHLDVAERVELGARQTCILIMVPHGRPLLGLSSAGTELRSINVCRGHFIETIQLPLPSWMKLKTKHKSQNTFCDNFFFFSLKKKYVQKKVRSINVEVSRKHSGRYRQGSSSPEGVTYRLLPC